jgi:CMP-N,N'-diacetyllegionaminic acid synthase
MTPALAIILARGGSKGLPRKNALPIAGRACIEWTIEHAVNSHSIGDIIVSTDDDELLAIARRWTDSDAGRVIAMPRPADLASDTATIDAAARSALHAYEGSHSFSPRKRSGGWASASGDPRPTTNCSNTRSPLSPPASRLSPASPIVILYGNVPVRPADLTDRAVKLLVESGADSVQSYAPVGKYHPWWMARVDPDSGTVRPWEGDVLNHGIFRRQDLPPVYVPDGGVIAVRREALMLEIEGVRPGPHAFFGRDDAGRRRGVINPEGAVVDIDSRVDLLVAEALLNKQGAPHAHR